MSFDDTLEKRKPYRNKKILESARDEDCTMNSEYCNWDNSTTVFAHLNEAYAGKGMGQKADDCAGAYMCSGCHQAYDHNLISGDYMILRAFYRTIRRLLDKGVLK